MHISKQFRLLIVLTLVLVTFSMLGTQPVFAYNAEVSDNFDSPVLNMSQWSEIDWNDGDVSLNGEVVAHVTDGAGLPQINSQGQLMTIQEFGDFDAQIDFRIGEGWGSPAYSHLDGAYFGVRMADDTRFQITRIALPDHGNIVSVDYLGPFGYKDACVDVGNDNQATQGEFRIVRSGSTFDFYYDIGSGWQLLFSGIPCNSAGTPIVYTDPVKLYFGANNVWANQAFNTYYDDFKISYNADIWGPLVTVNLNPVAINTPVVLTSQVNDSTTGGSNIASAEYSFDDNTWLPMSLIGSGIAVNASVTLTSYSSPGVFTVYFRGTDDAGNVGPVLPAFLAIYDPSAGFVTGGGWINSPTGAYTANPTLAGKANFGFESKYLKGATVPTGNTEFQFQIGNLCFKSTSYQWLVVNQGGTNAQFKGYGTINGQGNYGFMLWATHSTLDTFRIKIWNATNENSVIYDNCTEQPIGGGSIIVHKAK